MKCEFGVKKVGFLGFVISPDGVGKEGDRVACIEDWPTPDSVKDVQVFLDLRIFIGISSADTRRFQRRSRTSLKRPRPSGNGPAKPTEPSRSSNGCLAKRQNCKTIVLQTDASGYAIAGILNQYDGFGTLQPVSFYSRKCTPAEQNYATPTMTSNASPTTTIAGEDRSLYL